MNLDKLLNPETEPLESLLKKLEIDPTIVEGKVVLITGGARGIGEQVARGLSHLGAKVAIVDKREIGKSVSDDINKKSGNSIFILADIAKPGQIKTAVEQTINTFEQIDILINNAVHFNIKSVMELTEEEWDYTFKTNVTAPLIASQLVIPGMLERKSGTILNMIAIEGMAHAAAMSSSKVGLRSFNFSLAAELPKEANINVMGFAPGLVATPLTRELFPIYCEKLNTTIEDYIKEKHSDGFEGLMPAEYCAAGLISCLVRSNEFNGLIADPFLPLEKVGIIKFTPKTKKESNEDSVSNQINRLEGYISEVTDINRIIEEKIAIRTEKLTKDKAYSFKLLKAFKKQSNELEYSKKLLENNQLSLERSNDDLSQFAHVVSHDLKAPLRAINSLITFIEEDLGEANIAQDIKANFNLIRARIKRMENLINGILEYSKVGQEESSNELTDFNELLENVQFMLSVPENFELKIAPNLPHLYGNRTQFQQVFQNLLSNAIKYHDKEKGKIEIGFEETNDNYEFWVKDDGPGIKKQFHEKVFGIFQTLQPRDKIESTGVGLSIIKKIILQHDGDIWVESDGETGSTFRFRLPKTKAAA